MSASEKTPLMASSPKPGSNSNFYFLSQRSDSKVYEPSPSAEVIKETEPAAADESVIPSRPVAVSNDIPPRSPPPPSAADIRAKKEAAIMLKERKAPIKVEPKVFFANERTFLAWLHTSVLLASASIAILAFARSNPWSQLYGIVLLPVAISFIVYAMYQYTRRGNMIRRKEPGPYDDTTGPIVLGIMLMISITAQFAIKLYTIW